MGGREADKQLHSAVMTTDGPHICEAFVTAFVLCKATCFFFLSSPSFRTLKKEPELQNFKLSNIPPHSPIQLQRNS